MTVSLCGNMNADIPMQNIFPLYVILAQPVDDLTDAESAVYQVNRACKLTSFSEFGMEDQIEANFIIPEMKKLSAGGQVGNLTIVLVSNGEAKGASVENSLLRDHDEVGSFPSKIGGNYFWGKIPIESLCSSQKKCVPWSLGYRVEMILTTDMHPTILKNSFQVQVTICAQEVGAKQKPPGDSYSLRTGNVLFNYKYNTTLWKIEVTEDFSCPFCLIQCASFKGLRYHLCSCHDLFNFEFWVTEDYQTVNVSVKTDIWRSEVGFDPRLHTFCYCSKFKRPRRSKNIVQNVNNIRPRVLEVDSPEATQQSAHYLHDAGIRTSHVPVRHPVRSELPKGFSDGSSYRVEEGPSKALFDEEQMLCAQHKLESYGSANHHAVEYTEPGTSSPDVTGVYTATAQACMSNEDAQPITGNTLAPPTLLQFSKMRKLSVEWAGPRNRQILQKRKFFHSHTAQPMALEQVYSDHDSEDEVDDDLADFEDRRLFEDFVDVTSDEKQIMHLWNSFVRRQRLLADGHISWACEAFSQLHGQDLVQAPALIWVWRLFMVKLWNLSLLDARTMNNCNIILERYQSGIVDPNEIRR